MPGEGSGLPAGLDQELPRLQVQAHVPGLHGSQLLAKWPASVHKRHFPRELLTPYMVAECKALGSWGALLGPAGLVMSLSELRQPQMKPTRSKPQAGVLVDTHGCLQQSEPRVQASVLRENTGHFQG